ncbi:MAG: hypothetical protein JSU77_10630 [Fidelibacterota bacterium]|nr:MAG: hypothetical protein JSU77_10630 [Candidatus Neomarinimicrobiota bacterium]
MMLFLWATADKAQSLRHLNSDLLNLQLLSEEDIAILESLLDNPVNLNRASSADLWFLDDSLVSIVLIARQSDPFSDWDDLARRTLLPPEQINSLQQYLILLPVRDVNAKLSTRLVNTGADERIRTRLNLNGRQWAAQWVAQRDPGEYHLSDLSDLSITVRRNSTHLALGAHRMTWGLGLVLADEFAAPRGETLLRPLSRAFNLRSGYSNTNAGVLRGASIRHNWRRFQLLAGASVQQADITTDPDGTYRAITYRAHTGPAKVTGETLYYLAGTTKILGWDVGGLAARYQLQAHSGTPDSRHRTGSLITMRSFKTQEGELSFCHEEAVQQDKPNTAWQIQQRARQTRLSYVVNRGRQENQLRLTLLYRSYPPGWTALRGRLVGDRVSRGNESGWFFGWRWGQRPLQLNGYLDSFRQVEPQLMGSWPREGLESGLAVRAGKRQVETSLFYRYREEIASAGSLNNENLHIVQHKIATTHYVRFTLANNGFRNLTARFMIAYRATGEGSEQGRGETIGGSLRYHFRSDISFAVGAYGFATDGWAQRLYVYEDGLPGEFNFRVLSGRGMRIYGKTTIPVGQGSISLRFTRLWGCTDPRWTTLQVDQQVGLQMDIAL